MKLRLISILVFIFLSSCFKEDIIINSPQPGSVNTVQIEIGYPYLNQVYYNCDKNKIISSNSRYDWDLAFECGINGYHIKLNTAKGILSSNQGQVAFSAVTSTAGIDWQWDNSNGNLDSTAIGTWTNQTVYIINLQSDQNGNNLGFKKVVFQSVTDTSYTFKYADLDGSNENNYTIYKDDSVNFICFSYSNGGQTKHIEPPKNQWDLLFTNYQNFFTNLPLPFVITGVLSNKCQNILIAEDTLNQFINLSLKDTINYTFSNYADAIGYDWKIRNPQDNSFIIDEKKSYLLKNQMGLFFKLRFIDFYNNQGQKGYPKFEIQKL